MNQITVGLIVPCYYGLGFLDVCEARGYKVVAIASSPEDPKKYGFEGRFKDLIISDLMNPIAIVKAIRSAKIRLNALIPGDEYVLEVGNEAAKMMGLKYIDTKGITNSRLKDKTRELLDKNNLPNAKFAAITNWKEAKKAAKKIGYPLIFKPSNRASSQYVSLIKDEKELEKVFNEVSGIEDLYFGIKTRKVFLLEEFIKGDEFSVELFLQDGKPKFASVTEKISSPLPYFVELGHVVPASIDDSKKETLIKGALGALKAIGLNNGPAHVELRLSPKGPIIMEINARPAGGMIAQSLLINAFGVNLYSATVDYYLGNNVNITQTKKMAAAVARLVSNKTGTLKGIKGVKALNDIQGLISSNLTIKSGDKVNLPKNNDDRYGTVITIGKSPIEAKNNALKAISALTLEVI